MTNKDIFSGFLSAAAFIISFLTFVFNLINNQEVYKFNYDNQVNNNKPILFLDSIVSSIEIDKRSSLEPDPFNDSILILKGNNNHLTTFNMTNEGHDNAKIKAVFSIDTLGTDDILRKDILNQIKHTNLKTGFYSKYSDLPNLSKKLRYQMTVSTPLKDFDTITTHIMVVYENDIGNLYDSYVWVTFIHAMPSISEIRTTPPNLPTTHTSYITHLDSFKIVTLIDQSYSFHAYTENEKKVFYNIYR